MGLLAGGAALAAGSAVAFTVIEALSKPDRRGEEPSADVESFTQVSGLILVGAASASAVLMAIGGAVALDEALPASALPASALPASALPASALPADSSPTASAPAG